MANEKEFNTEKSLVDCQVIGNQNSTNIDPVPGECCDTNTPSQKAVATNPVQDWKLPKKFSKLRIGQHGNCDPLMTGQIINDNNTPNRNVIYRYSRAIRGADEAMIDLFRNLVVIDESGKAHVVPIMWGTQEQAVGTILQDNVRDDTSLVVDRIRLPILAISNTGTEYDPTRFTYQQAQTELNWLEPDGDFGFTETEKLEKDTVFGVTRGIPVNIAYTLYAWTLYEEDMNQILEQVLLKFSPVAYIRVRGVWWEIIVTLDGQANNFEFEPGDKKLRVLKYQFNFTTKSYIPQPITRHERRCIECDQDDLELQQTVNELKNLIKLNK